MCDGEEGGMSVRGRGGREYGKDGGRRRMSECRREFECEEEVEDV